MQGSTTAERRSAQSWSLTRRRRRHRAAIRLTLVTSLLLALGPLATTSAEGAGAIPNCPPGTNAALLRNCVIRSWADPAQYGFPMTASLAAPLTRTWRKASASSGYAHWIYTAKVRVHVPVAMCPQPTPLSSIPCQDGAIAVGVRWYQPGPRTSPPAPFGFSVQTSSCNASDTSCVVTFAVYPELLYGAVRTIWSVSGTQLIKDPSNDLGQAGAQFPVSFGVARVKKP